MRTIRLAASILSADFRRLEAHAREALDAGADWLHVDVMDGRFVPNLTIGPLVVEALRPLADETGALLDVHLMMERPERWIEPFVRAGADAVTVHVEACTHLHRAVQRIRQLGAQPGATLNPATPLVSLEPILPELALVLVMSVNPGFGGQAYIAASTERVRWLRERLDALESRAHLSVDGGIKPQNAAEVAAAGADVLVAGSAIFGGADSVAANVSALRAAVRR